ncbi:hypothetical protein C8J57DRAFT_1636659 [Mycena rebaudengoi]|nr:hypothetical protein C8J57DRAFT_1636659 [Mycena rebaudengoi]
MPHPSLWLLGLLPLLFLALCGLVYALDILPHRRAGIALLPTADPAARTSAVPSIPPLRGRGRAKKSAFGRRLLPFARSRRDPVLPRHYRAAFAGRGGARVDTDDDATPLLDVFDATSTWRSISSISSSSSGELVDLGPPPHDSDNNNIPINIYNGTDPPPKAHLTRSSFERDCEREHDGHVLVDFSAPHDEQMLVDVSVPSSPAPGKNYDTKGKGRDTTVVSPRRTPPLSPHWHAPVSPHWPASPHWPVSLSTTSPPPQWPPTPVSLAPKSPASPPPSTTKLSPPPITAMRAVHTPTPAAPTITYIKPLGAPVKSLDTSALDGRAAAIELREVHALPAPAPTPSPSLLAPPLAYAPSLPLPSPKSVPHTLDTHASLVETQAHTALMETRALLTPRPLSVSYAYSYSDSTPSPDSPFLVRGAPRALLFPRVSPCASDSDAPADALKDVEEEVVVEEEEAEEDAEDHDGLWGYAGSLGDLVARWREHARAWEREERALSAGGPVPLVGGGSVGRFPFAGGAHRVPFAGGGVFPMHVLPRDSPCFPLEEEVWAPQGMQDEEGQDLDDDAPTPAFECPVPTPAFGAFPSAFATGLDDFADSHDLPTERADVTIPSAFGSTDDPDDFTLTRADDDFTFALTNADGAQHDYDHDYYDAHA